MLRGGEVILLFLPLTFNCNTKCEVNVRLKLIFVCCIPNKIQQTKLMTMLTNVIPKRATQLSTESEQNICWNMWNQLELAEGHHKDSS